MKKVLSYLLIICVIFSLFGCKKDEKPREKETEPTISTDAEVSQRPMMTVSIPTVTETTTADDGTEIFHYVYPVMDLIFPDAAVAQKVLDQHRSRLLAHLEPVEDMRIAAQQDYSSGMLSLPYLYSISYQPMRMDMNVMSFFGNCITYMGGAHPNSHGFGVNYNMVTGDVLTLGSILTHVDKKEALKALLVEELDKIAQERHLIGYKEYINIRFRTDESDDKDWFFTNTGLCFFFSPYEIAPYSEGTIVAEIPYTSLSGIIADEFFPGERMPYHGSITEVAFSDADLTKFTQTAEVTLQPDSKKTLYYTDTAVQDFKILQLHPVTGNLTVVFAAPYLTPGDAVLLEASDEMKKNLTVSYIDGTQEITITY